MPPFIAIRASDPPSTLCPCCGGPLAKHDGVVLDLSRNVIVIDDVARPVSPSGIKMLELLLANSPNVVSRSRLIDHVWGTAKAPFDRTVDTIIKRTRPALGKNSRVVIQTHYGSGYAAVIYPKPAPATPKVRHPVAWLMEWDKRPGTLPLREVVFHEPVPSVKASCKVTPLYEEDDR